MAAETVASFKMVLSMIVDEAVYLYGVKNQVDRAREKIQDMYVFIRDAETQLPAAHEMLSYFVLKMREAVHNLEDVVAAYLSSGSIGRRVNTKMSHRVRSEREKEKTWLE
ncbi:hypothetical protein TIFTF001_041664 [Ficus carica]|uniref:Disease resistance N-terminal domain-containing protein n=1 Tax=Ficus carica TaxID=3494 RepID=A0AA88A081_FICCA|nr:hypothetical protein TIFTF001_041664 [Ficus carica]